MSGAPASASVNVPAGEIEVRECPASNKNHVDVNPEPHPGLRRRARTRSSWLLVSTPEEARGRCQGSAASLRRHFVEHGSVVDCRFSYHRKITSIAPVNKSERPSKESFESLLS
jgi:hypothetical protein